MNIDKKEVIFAVPEQWG